MRNQKQVPSEFLAVAEALDIPTYLAIEFYIRLNGKKGVDDLANKLASIRKVRRSDVNQPVSLLRKTFNSIRNNSFVSTHSTSISKTSLLDIAVKELEARIGKIRNDAPVREVPTSVVKEVVISDLHIPFHNEKALEQVLSEEADVLYIVGDFLDMYSASRHRKKIPQANVFEELKVGTAVMKLLAEKFAKVYCVLGNHDMRVMNQLQQVAPQLLPLVNHPLEVIGRGFGNVEMLSHDVPNTKPHILYGEDHNMEYMGVAHDTIYGHFERFCGNDAHEKLGSWINENNKILGFETNPRVIVQAHTHRLTATFHPIHDQVHILCGSLCNPMGYIFDNAGVYKAPTTGYVTMTKYDGVTDINNIKLVKVR